MSDENQSAGEGGEALDIPSGGIDVDAAAKLLLMEPPKANRKKQAEASAEDDDTATPDDEDTDEAPAPEEDTEGEDADDSDEEADDEDEDTEEDSSPYASDEAKVKLDDGSETTIAELKKGSLRQADYTRKTMQLAEERKSFQERDAKLAEYLPNIKRQLQFAEKMVELSKPLPPPQELEYEDPVRFLQLDRHYRAALNEWEAYKGEVIRGLGETDGMSKDKDTRSKREKLQAAEEQLRQQIPDLYADGKRDKLLKSMRDTAKELGYTDDEMNGMDDARFVRLLHLAAKADRLEKAKPQVAKKVEGKPPVQHAGSRSSGSEKGLKQAKAMRRLRETGSLDDAARALLS